jgi:hypothetical protein
VLNATVAVTMTGHATHNSHMSLFDTVCFVVGVFLPSHEQQSFRTIVLVALFSFNQLICLLLFFLTSIKASFIIYSTLKSRICQSREQVIAIEHS